MPVDVSQINALAAELAVAGSTVAVKAHGVVAKATSVVKSQSQSRAAVLTGELRGSITGRTAGLTGTVTASSQHALFNEFGTSRMAPQPFMYPALSDAEQPFITAMEKIAEVF
jgi:HK97 gp10 family phage protein